MGQSIAIEKAEAFAIRIVNLSRYIREQKEYSLADQILRSGTSICANLYEGKFAQSNADFISKLSIALKEASESDFWLKLFYKTNIISESLYESFNNDIREIIGILVSTINTLKAK